MNGVVTFVLLTLVSKNTNQVSVLVDTILYASVVCPQTFDFSFQDEFPMTGWRHIMHLFQEGRYQLQIVAVNQPTGKKAVRIDKLKQKHKHPS